MSDLFIPVIATRYQIDHGDVEVTAGQFIATSDTHELFIDTTTEHVKYSDVVFDTYANITGQATPLVNKLYFATDTHQLLQATYNGASVTWTELGGSSGNSGTDNAGTAVVLNGTKKSIQSNVNLGSLGGTRGNGAIDIQTQRYTQSQVASGYCSIAIGTNNGAIGDYAFAAGITNTSSGQRSVAMGYNNTASGRSSIAMGESNDSGNSGYSNYSVAIGYGNTASGYSSVAMGYGNTASVSYSVAIGYYNTASGYCSVAMGDSSIASGYSSVAMGKVNIVSGEHSVALGGSGNISKGSYSSVLGGENNTASGKHSVALGGNDNKAKANNVVVSGDKAIGSIEGAVCNNNRLIGYYAPANAFYQNTAGHCGFKGIRIPIAENSPGYYTYTSIFKLEVTDVAILRVNIINSTENTYGIFDLVITNCYLTQRIPVYQNLESNVNDIFDMIGSKLCMRRHLDSEYQIGIFYTIFRQGSEEGQSSSSSSSES